MSILDGTGSLVDEWLQVKPKGKPPCYRHRSAAIDLSQRKTPITGTLGFLEASYAQIHANWLAAVDAGYSNPSRENWRWKRHLEISRANLSPELNLERAIVNACGNDWSNQMPAASGLVGPATDKRAAIDLVYRENKEIYSFIELKVDSNNPLFAAIEILMYGLLFVWSRNNCDRLGYDVREQPVLEAKDITFAVLAPGDYYRNFELTNFASAVDKGVAKFGKRHGVDLRFEFKELPADTVHSSEREALCCVQELFVAT